MQKLSVRLLGIALFLSIAAPATPGNRPLPGQNNPHYEWDQYGACWEVLADGRRFGRASLDACRRTRGSYYAQDANYNCYEYTPSGARIGIAHISHCQ